MWSVFVHKNNARRLVASEQAGRRARDQQPLARFAEVEGKTAAGVQSGQRSGATGFAHWQ